MALSDADRLQMTAIALMKHSVVQTESFASAKMLIGKGTAIPSVNNGTVLLHMDGDNYSTIIENQIHSGPIVTAVGNAHLSTAAYKFGTSSLYLDGSSYAKISNNNSLAFGDSDFTIDCWIRLPTYVSGNRYCIFSHFSDTSSTYAIFEIVGNRLEFSAGSLVGLYSFPLTWNTDTWYHVALVRSGSNLTMYRNGIAVTIDTSCYYTKFSSSASFPTYTGDFQIGMWAKNLRGFTGYIDEFRIIKGKARWTSNFEVPTSATEVPANIYVKNLSAYVGCSVSNIRTASKISNEMAQAFISQINCTSVTSANELADSSATNYAEVKYSRSGYPDIYIRFYGDGTFGKITLIAANESNGSAIVTVTNTFRGVNGSYVLVNCSFCKAKSGIVLSFEDSYAGLWIATCSKLSDVKTLTYALCGTCAPNPGDMVYIIGDDIRYYLMEDPYLSFKDADSAVFILYPLAISTAISPSSDGYPVRYICDNAYGASADLVSSIQKIGGRYFYDMFNIFVELSI